jgi:outer membrane protein assembly factor BamC
MHRPASAPSLALLAVAVALSACSTIDNFLQGDKIDYKSQSTKTTPLEVPPDLTQLQREGRYAPQAGIVSASTYQGAAANAATATNMGAAAVSVVPAVAPAALGEMRIVREGNQRWLVVPMPAEQLWPQLRSFWAERGFNLVVDNAEAGVMETDWAENRAKIPQDVIRRSIGRVFDSLYDTGERDRFRVRVERSGGASEVYLSHRGMQEIYTTDKRDQTVWTPRPSDPQLEAEFLSRLMVKLGTREAVARETVAKAIAAPAGPARARALAGQAGAMQVDEGFDRAWRRVGLALDRGGFTVEDRDRAGGLYFVRYVDPKNAATNADPGFFGKLFSFGKSDATPAVRYRIALKADGERTTVAVQNSQGGPETSEIGQRIVALLVEDLK